MLAAATLHVLLAVLIVPRARPPVAEPPVMDVALLPMTRRERPHPASPLPQAPPARDRAAAPRVESATPSPPAAKAAAPGANWRVRPSDPSEPEGARAALRGRVGCRSADLLALTKAERAACEDALAKGAETAPTYAVISPKLKKVFDKTFECPKGDVWCEYRIGKAPYPGLLAPRKPPRDRSWDQD